MKAVRTRLSSADRVSVALACVLAALAVVFGLHAGEKLHDQDELVYAQTLTAMQHGRGYYPAMRDALVDKDGAPPSEIRSVREPTMFLALARVPQRGWRFAVGAVYLACLLLAWRLGRFGGGLGGPVAVGFVGIWLLGASSYLYLHAELWGLPFLLAGVLALRRERWAQAALLLAVAALVRELYAVAFVAGFLCTRDRRWWWPVGGIAAALGIGHAVLASAVLSPLGNEPPFGTDHFTWQYALNALSPMDQPVGYLLGGIGLALATCALVRTCRHDRGARTLLCYTAAMAPLSILIGRNYWALAFGPVMACFAVEGLRSLVRAPTAAPAFASLGADEFDEALLEIPDLVA